MNNLTDYALSQLKEIKRNTDPVVYPLRHMALCKEIEKRENAQQCLGAEGSGAISKSDTVPINRWFIRFIGVLSIGGSFIGITTIINHLMQPQGIFSYLIFGLFALVFVVGIVVAIRLLEHCSLGALTDNRNFWAIQTVFFSSPVMAYQLTNGLLINIWLTSTDGLQHGLMIGSAFSLNFLNMNQPWAVGINVIAIVVTAYIQWHLNAFTRRQQALGRP